MSLLVLVLGGFGASFLLGRLYGQRHPPKPVQTTTRRYGLRNHNVERPCACCGNQVDCDCW